MNRKQLHFFATANDLKSVLSEIQVRYSVEYVTCGLFAEKTPKVFVSWEEIPNLGIAKSGKSIVEPSYLVNFIGNSVFVRDVPQRKGGVLYAVDQLKNPETITIQLGGIHPPTGVLISGNISTISTSSQSIELFKNISKVIKHHFSKVSGYYLGKESDVMFNENIRLTFDFNSPMEYDFKIN